MSDFKFKLIAFGLAIAIILLAQSSYAAEVSKPAENGTDKKEDSKATDSSGQLSIIGWDTYRRLFNKSYSSYQQLMVRQKIFMSKTLEVFLTAIKYRLNQIAYYTSINRFSDLTPEEATKILSGDSGEDSDDEDNMMDEEEARRALLEVLNERTTQVPRKKRTSRKKKTKGSRRYKRSSTDGAAKTFERQLSFKDLIKTPGGQNALKNLNVHIRWVVPPTNPDYQQFEQMSMGLGDYEDDQQAMRAVEDIPAEKLREVEAKATQKESQTLGLIGKALGVVSGAYNWVSTHRPKMGGGGGKPESQGKATWAGSAYGAVSGAYNWLSKSKGQPEAVERDVAEEKSAETETARADDSNSTSASLESLNDLLINDWRTSGCVAPPIDQGDCESCYAISSMGFVEWAFCMAQGSALTPLSPQYMVSCGLQFKTEGSGRAHFSGCERGWSKYSMLFIEHYGVELEANMPYMAAETECPIPPDMPANKRGYIRPDVKQTIRMGPATKQLDLALATGPVIVSFKEPKNFLDYGGGMVDHCYDRGGHTMLIVGNGVDDGVEYLLIKNSFGTGWGMDGFFKFKRSAIGECVKQFITAKLDFPGLEPAQPKPTEENKEESSADSSAPATESLADKIINSANQV